MEQLQAERAVKDGQRAEIMRLLNDSVALDTIEPQIKGHASDGIRGVETFLLDMVCLLNGIEMQRAPRILVHDSHLFDSIDHRQVASCLNIGARLAEENDFQYIVTMNSDFLTSVESEGAFDRADYVVNLPLTDASDDGGLFGFQFD